MPSRSLDTAIRSGIGLYDRRSAESRSGFSRKGAIRADLNADGMMPADSERLRSSVMNGAIRSAASFSWGTGNVSAAQLLFGSGCMTSTKAVYSSVSDVVVGASRIVGGEPPVVAEWTTSTLTMKNL